MFSPGDPKNESDKVFLRAWNIDQVYDHICSAYPGRYSTSVVL